MLGPSSQDSRQSQSIIQCRGQISHQRAPIVCLITHGSRSGHLVDALGKVGWYYFRSVISKVKEGSRNRESGVNVIITVMCAIGDRVLLKRG